MRAIPFLGLCLLGGCVSADLGGEWVYTPAEVLAATQELNGKEISVRGWLGGCNPADRQVCGIYSNRRAAQRAVDEWPLPISMDREGSLRVREIVARGTYVIDCRNDETTICVEYNGSFHVVSIED